MKHKNYRGGKFNPGILSTAFHLAFGIFTGASADGRKSKVQLSNGVGPFNKNIINYKELTTYYWLVFQKILKNNLSDSIGQIDYPLTLGILDYSFSKLKLFTRFFQITPSVC